jgi:hypothetical protein
MARSAVRRLAAIALCAGSLACSTFYPPGEVDQTLERAVGAAQALVQRGQPVEAAQFVRAASRINPQSAGLSELEQALGAQAQLDLFRPSALGINRPRRYEVRRSVPERLLLYLPDRLADLLDTVSFEAHFGPGSYLKAHVTRAAQLGGGVRAVAGLGTYSARSLLGVSARSSAEFSVLPLSVGAAAEGTASAAGVRSGAQLLKGLQQPTDLYYQDFADYWSVGAEATIGLVGVVLGLHPLQVGDFVAGIVGVDFLDDDLSHTRGLQLSAEQGELLERLGSMERSRQTMQAYRSIRTAPEPRPPAAAGD